MEEINDGYINLNKNDIHPIENKKVTGEHASYARWIKIGENEYIEKYDPEETENERQFLIIAEELLNKLNIPHASYVLGIDNTEEFQKEIEQYKEKKGIKEKDVKNKENKVQITKSFLRPGEKIIHGSEISEFGTPVNKRIELLKQYFKEKGMNEEKINHHIGLHLREQFVARWLGITDFHEDNWGFIENEKGEFIKETPLFDYSCCTLNAFDNDIANDLEDNKPNTIENFMKEYGNYPEVKEIISRISNSEINIKELFQNAKKRTNFKIEDEESQKEIIDYIDIIIKRSKELNKEIEQNKENTKEQV